MTVSSSLLGTATTTREEGREEEDEKSQESSIFWDIGGRQDSLDKEGVVHTHIM